MRPIARSTSVTAARYLAVNEYTNVSCGAEDHFTW